MCEEEVVVFYFWFWIVGAVLMVLLARVTVVGVDQTMATALRLPELKRRLTAYTLLHRRLSNRVKAIKNSLQTLHSSVVHERSLELNANREYEAASSSKYFSIRIVATGHPTQPCFIAQVVNKNKDSPNNPVSISPGWDVPQVVLCRAADSARARTEVERAFPNVMGFRIVDLRTAPQLIVRQIWGQ
jgi:hypothetical protein